MASFQESIPVPFSLYSDPDRSIFRALGMGTPMPDMMMDVRKGGVIKKSSKTLRRGLMHLQPTNALTSTRHHILGGEFVLGPGNRASFAHRLTHPAEHTEVVSLLNQLGVTNPMLPLRQQIDPVDRARAPLETVDYWSAEKPYYNQGGSSATTSSNKPSSAVPPTTTTPNNLLQESKQRLSLFWGRRHHAAPTPSSPMPTNRRAGFDALTSTHVSEALHNPDPFSEPVPTPGSTPGGPSWRTTESVSSAPVPRTDPHEVPASRPGRPGKISVRQLTTAALQPMPDR